MPQPKLLDFCTFPNGIPSPNALGSAQNAANDPKIDSHWGAYSAPQTLQPVGRELDAPSQPKLLYFAPSPKSLPFLPNALWSG